MALAPVAAAHADPGRWQDNIAEASGRFGIPEPWIRAVMQVESGGRTTQNGQPITSRAGAMGLMQMMPATYEEMRRTHNLGPDAYDPRDNILAGTAYLRAMFKRYGYPAMFSAYNAGPERYEQSLRDRPLPDETRRYLPNVTRALAGTAPEGGMTPVPAGWAVELAVAASSARARLMAWQVLVDTPRFAKGRIVTVSRLSGGTVRWRGLATELAEADATQGCLALRAQAGDDVCLVLTPEMVAGAFEEQGRLRRAMTSW